jgi:protein-disulfide isomerase
MDTPCSTLRTTCSGALWRWSVGSAFAVAVAVLGGCLEPGDASEGTDMPDLVARWNGGAMSLHEAERLAGDDLRELDMEYRLQRYELLARAVDRVVEREILVRYAARRGQSVEALIEAEVAASVAQPGEAELQAEFEEFRKLVPGARYDDARPFLVRELHREAVAKAREQFVARLKREHDLTLTLPYPDLPRADVAVRPHNPRLGPDEAPVTIVQFAEFQCSYCRTARPVLERIVADYPGKVRVVFKDFPLPGHERARMAAVAAKCAHEQDKYFEIADHLYANPGELDEPHLRGFAEAVGVRLADWDMCFRDPIWQANVAQDVEDGRAAGVSATPTYFVNGRRITGAQRYERFAALVEEALSELGVEGG